MSRNKKSTSGRGDKYKHPVPNRGEILDCLRDAGEPLKLDVLMEHFGLKGKRMRTRLTSELQKMVRAGQVILNRRGDFCLLEKLALVTGTVTGHPDGYGFLVRDDGGNDMYLSAREMRAVFHGDRIAVRPIGVDYRGRQEAKVVEVLERGTREVVGELILERGIGVVIPDNPKLAQRILIARGEAGMARHGQIVVAQILDYPTHVEQATGKIVRIIGDPEQKGIATDIAIHAHGIPTDWPKAVREQAKTFDREVADGAKRNRVDLRHFNLVTIDGADARDFDDAVYCETSGSGFRLLVAIADVAHYVEKGTPLDKQAIRRGTSVYFPDRVVPMLPEVLSNGLCSLKPKVDRLCLVCEMQISATGKVMRSKFYEAVMRSTARLTYGQVNEFLTGRSPGAIPKAVQEDVRRLHEVYELFAATRRRRGALELDIPQTRITVDRHGDVTSISAMQRNDAHRLIEECMIAANVEAAKFLRKHRVAGLYRVHEKPDPEKFDEVRQYLLTLGFKVPHPDHVQPGQLNRLVDQVRDRPDSVAISMALLRAMPHAEYTPKNIGHFGLALDAYAHFTSPIRRYPDLLVHRAIRHILQGGKAGNYGYDQDAMEHLGVIASEHERRAEDATREVEAWLKCQYMEDKIGEQFEGVVTSVTNFGLFVQIPTLQIDGLVHVTSLKRDYYRFDASSRSLVGERSGMQYALGDELAVVVARVDLETKRIDFQLATKTPDRKRKR